VTAENVAEVRAREETVSDGWEASREYYAAEIDAIFADVEGAVQSFADLLAQ
jgi:hypothetical protein